ncbi:BarP protein [Trypanosoma brucei equiperdum]|uniref:BarP protein n=1 Tax=Trypanosoma brucei equiperdum TaxID=630700 RepID=A0A3L6L5G4_9TRYP|nr:BarP protein [Trypanosoma brucei equiperdum]
MILIYYVYLSFLLFGSVLGRTALTENDGDEAVCELIKQLNGVPWDAVDSMKVHVRRNATVASQSGAIAEMEVRKAYAAVLRAASSQSAEAIEVVLAAFNKVRTAIVLCNEEIQRVRGLWSQFKDAAVRVVRCAEVANGYLKHLVDGTEVSFRQHVTDKCNKRERKNVTADSLKDAMQRALPFVKDPTIRANLTETEKLLRELEGIVGAASEARQGAAQQVPMAVAAGNEAAKVAISGLQPPPGPKPGPEPGPTPPPPPVPPERNEKPFYIILLSSIVLMVIVLFVLGSMALKQFCRTICYHKRIASGFSERELQAFADS